MLHNALVFLVLSLMAGLLGFEGLASAAPGFEKAISLVFLVSFS
jgi:uncharacterized membrane protein YtjA (UPF0391 family)